MARSPAGPVGSRRPTIGWREWVRLPDFDLPPIKAKIDTGARTSALHAFRIRPFRQGRRDYVEFFVHPRQRQRHPEIRCVAPLTEQRVVTSSSGARERRCVIRTRLQIGAAAWPIELTLTNRDEMGFRMLIGRQAIRGRYVVDPGRSYRSDKLNPKSGAST